jgi:hypothetical protein
MQEEFTRIYETNRWGGRVSRSGKGSDPEQTGEMVRVLRDFIRRRGVETLVDLGCGDMAWMWDVVGDLRTYWGVDIVDALMQGNRQERMICKASTQVVLLCEDVTEFVIPAADVVLCRDILCHLEYLDAIQIIENVKKSGAKWFMAGMYPKQGRGNPVGPFQRGLVRWYPPVLTKPPFNLPEPVEILSEGGVEQFVPGYEDKALGVWDISAL